VSALLLGGNPRRVLDLAMTGTVELCISDWISGEVERVLTAKFHWPSERLERATRRLWSSARWINPQQTVTDCADPDDNRVLECALEAQARCIITGDHHLLVLHPFREIDILTPRQFLDSKAWGTMP
jgi:putative PIN family toxin of toxin-antitoxin system